MAAMHYVGNFSAERSQLSAISDTISSELASMEATIDGMGSYWKDEKSASFISGAKDLIKELKDKKDIAIQEGNSIFTQVENALKIYE